MAVFDCERKKRLITLVALLTKTLALELALELDRVARVNHRRLL